MAELDAVVIIDHYKSLDDKGKLEFRAKVSEATGWPYSTFYNKMRTGNFSKAELFLLSTIIPVGKNA